jgi:hypothetical protein
VRSQSGPGLAICFPRICVIAGSIVVLAQLYSPTYQDVTRPVYRRSVARWHAYEKYLSPVLPVLAPYCRAFGYE